MRAKRSSKTPPSSERLAEIVRCSCSKINADEFASVTGDDIKDIKYHPINKWRFKVTVRYYGKVITALFDACVARGKENLAKASEVMGSVSGDGCKHRKGAPTIRLGNM